MWILVAADTCAVFVTIDDFFNTLALLYGHKSNENTLNKVFSSSRRVSMTRKTPASKYATDYRSFFIYCTYVQPKDVYREGNRGSFLFRPLLNECRLQRYRRTAPALYFITFYGRGHCAFTSPRVGVKRKQCEQVTNSRISGLLS